MSPKKVSTTKHYLEQYIVRFPPEYETHLLVGSLHNTINRNLVALCLCRLGRCRLTSPEDFRR